MSHLATLQKIEIYFWTTLVGMMKNQRAVRLTLILLAIAVLGGAIVIGSLVNNPRSDRSATAELEEFTPRANDPLPVAAKPVEFTHQQENYLIILVDSLIAQKPALEGVWLAGSASSVPQIVFLPLYPSHRKAEMETISSLFEIDPNGEPAAVFLDILRSKKIWWDHYLMTDRASLVEFIQIAGITGMDDPDWNGSDLVASLPKSAQAPQAALKVQAQIASELCLSVPGLIENTSPEILWGLLNHNMRSDLTLEKVVSIQEIHRLSGGTFACDFPTMQVMADWIGAE